MNSLRLFNWRAIPRITFLYAVLVVLAVISIFPFWWTIVTAFSKDGNPFEYPPPMWPQSPSLDNFIEVFHTIPMLHFYKNSILITVWAVLWKLVLCSLAAYPLARMEFRGKKLIFILIMSTMVLPSEANFLANFITLNKLRLTDTIAGVILPNVVTAVAIFVLKQAFEEIPQDLIDAARVDGASEWQIFWRVMLPLITPWLATVGILTAVETWNDYIWPSIVLNHPDSFPLSSGILYLRGTYGSSTRVIAAGTVLTIVPILVMFLLTQRFFMRGLDGAVK
jgi:putative chitobiose transport system permease protein